MHVILFLSPKNEIFFPPNTLTSVWTFVLVLRQKNPDMLNFDILAIYGCPDLSGIILPIFGPLEGFFYVSRSSNKYWTKKRSCHRQLASSSLIPQKIIKYWLQFILLNAKHIAAGKVYTTTPEPKKTIGNLFC